MHGNHSATLQGKGSKTQCCNYRAITLLSVPGKVFVHVLLDRIKPLLLSKRRQEQSGFTPGRSTVDLILTLNILAQTRKEFHKPLFAAYVDLKAAFDSVDRQVIWQLLLALSLPRMWCARSRRYTRTRRAVSGSMVTQATAAR